MIMKLRNQPYVPEWEQEEREREREREREEKGVGASWLVYGRMRISLRAVSLSPHLSLQKRIVKRVGSVRVATIMALLARSCHSLRWMVETIGQSVNSPITLPYCRLYCCGARNIIVVCDSEF
jgi:hypothetical protein